jgi:hypothetical protein
MGLGYNRRPHESNECNWHMYWIALYAIPGDKSAATNSKGVITCAKKMAG